MRNDQRELGVGVQLPPRCRVGEGRDVHYRSRKYPTETECGIGGAFGGPVYDVEDAATCRACRRAVRGFHPDPPAAA